MPSLVPSPAGYTSEEELFYWDGFTGFISPYQFSLHIQGPAQIPGNYYTFPLPASILLYSRGALSLGHVPLYHHSYTTVLPLSSFPSTVATFSVSQSADSALSGALLS